MTSVSGNLFFLGVALSDSPWLVTHVSVVEQVLPRQSEPSFRRVDQ